VKRNTCAVKMFNGFVVCDEVHKLAAFLSVFNAVYLGSYIYLNHMPWDHRLETRRPEL